MKWHSADWVSSFANNSWVEIETKINREGQRGIERDRVTLCYASTGTHQISADRNTNRGTNNTNAASIRLLQQKGWDKAEAALCISTTVTRCGLLTQSWRSREGVVTQPSAHEYAAAWPQRSTSLWTQQLPSSRRRHLADVTSSSARKVVVVGRGIRKWILIFQMSASSFSSHKTRLLVSRISRQDAAVVAALTSLNSETH